MESIMKELEHLKIQEEEINLATNNFDDNKIIGSGGFGKVYEGKLCHSKGYSMVAIKRLDRQFGQGDVEFLKEITMLSRYTHENLIPLLGFCDSGGEKILVYEYASNGSLDRHLGAATLTWTQRIKICLDIAKGLSYLHGGKVAHQRVLHRDIKSSNTLLDEKWNAKVSDLGLSKVGPANQKHTALITNVVGTPGYCDPQYMDTYTLTKESDIYSFGVVLFEVFCGRLCYEYNNGQLKVLVNTWKKCYEEKKLDEIIFQDLVITMDPLCLEEFSDIAFQCLHNSSEKRPKVSFVVEKLEIALDLQEISEWKETLFDYLAISRSALPPLKYGSEEELSVLLSQGVFVNGGKTWFSIDGNGEHCEMILITDPFLPTDERPMYEELRTRVKTQFLSPLTTYTLNLVFKIRDNDEEEDVKEYYYMWLRYKLKGEKKYLCSYLADNRGDGYYTTELYQFTSDKSFVDLEIIFYIQWKLIKVEGIVFLPIEKVEHQVLENENGVDMLSISDSYDIYWEQIFPNDYQDIINCSIDVLQWKTKKQLYSILCKGLLIKDGQEWFSLDKIGKRCLMLSTRATFMDVKYDIWRSLPESRFGEVLEIGEYNHDLYLLAEIKTQVLSPQTTYATYLVYKLPEDQSTCDTPVDTRYIGWVSDNWVLVNSWCIYLVSPQTPVIMRKVDENTFTPLNRPKIECIPQHRDDGWMEVQIWGFETATTSETILMRLQMASPGPYHDTWLRGLIIQGIEFRPI